MPKQRGCLRIIVLILVQMPRAKRISCKTQAGAPPRLTASLDVFPAPPYPPLTTWPLQDLVLLRGLCGRINPFLTPPPTHTLPTLLHYCGRAIAQYTTPLRPPCVYHAPYNIGNGNIVLRPSQSPPAAPQPRLPGRFSYASLFTTLHPPRLAFTRYCHYQSRMVYGIHEGGRGWGAYIAQ